MALYYYERYRVNGGYYNAAFGGTTDSGITESGYYGYSSIHVDPWTGAVTGSGARYGMNGTSYTVFQIRAGGYQVLSISPDGSYYTSTYHVVYVSTTRGSFIDTITAEDGTYPSNGSNGSYWYVKKSIVSRPTVVKPVGGEVVTGLYTIEVTLGNGAITDNLKTQIELTTNNGQTWVTLVTLNTGVSTFNYDFSQVADSNVSRIRAKHILTNGTASDIGLSELFTTQKNIAPLSPTNLTPSGTIIDRTKTIRLAWKHNDADAQSKAIIEWRLQGATTWTAITVGAEQEHTISANGLPLGQIEWRVRTYDQLDLVSPYSNIAVFSAVSPTSAPTITAPLSPVGISRPVVEWLAVAQASYQIVIEDGLGVVIWDTGEVISANKSAIVGIDLLNGGTYKIKVRLKDNGGLFSAYVDATIDIAYTPPPKPIVTAFINKGGIQLSIGNPEPSGTQPNMTNNEIYKIIDGNWVRIATNVLSVYADYAVASNEDLQYSVRTLGDNGTFSESGVINAVAPKLSGVYLHDVQDPEMTIHHYKFDGLDGKSDSLQREHAYRQFAGRKRPVIEYGTFTNYQRQVTLNLVRDEIGRKRLIQFVDDGAILLYRDGRGRKFYTTLPIVAINDIWYGNDVPLTLTEIDYREEV